MRSARGVVVERRSTYRELRLLRRVHAGASMLPDARVSPRQHTRETPAPCAPPGGGGDRKRHNSKDEGRGRLETLRTPGSGPPPEKPLDHTSQTCIFGSEFLHIHHKRIKALYVNLAWCWSTYPVPVFKELKSGVIRLVRAAFAYGSTL